LLSAFVAVASGAYLASDLGQRDGAAASASQASVEKASRTPSISAAPSDDDLAGRARRRNRRAYRRWA
jgi:hypothetical protein